MNNLTTKHLQLAKDIADTIWSTYDDTYGYGTEKKEINKEVSTNNIDNIYFFVGQFDWKNQSKMIEACKEYGKIGEQLSSFISKKYLDSVVQSYFS